MTRFDECLSFVLRHEGGYTNNPLDRGGATNRGITQGTLDAWRISQGLPRSPVSGLSGQEINAIYQKKYWTPVCAGNLDAPLDLVVFDAAVQHGPSRAVRWLQESVECQQDGIAGPKTLQAVSAFVERHGLHDLMRDYMLRREDYYHAIVEKDPKQVVFARGWAIRMTNLYEEIQTYK